MADDRDTDGSDFDGEITQPLAFALSLERAATTRVNSAMFRRLAETLEVREAALETLIYEALVYVDATPESLEASDVWTMRTCLFDLADGMTSAESRERARAALELLLFEIAPVDPVG